MKSKYVFAIPLLYTFMMMGCDKNEIPTPKSTAPEIIVINPQNSGATYTSGDTIMLEVQFSDDEELHEMAVFIIRLYDGAMVYQKNLHNHSDSYRWVDLVPLETDSFSEFEVRAVATDHELQRTQVSVKFDMHP
ncbi:MAG: hypothetical protein EP314_00315 [Bacteroidetes bacterium]|nr:MAG: hypothetical protein EP314_00315 [Bacteroidota bacterium]